MYCGFKNKLRSCIILISACIFPVVFGFDDSGQKDQAMQFVKMVQKRYYLVHRLEKPVNFLIRFYESVTKNTTFDTWSLIQLSLHKGPMVPAGVSSQFRHPLVVKYIRALEHEQSAQAISDLWSDFLSYKHIEDELFVRETIIAIMVVYKMLVLNLNPVAPKDFLSLKHDRVPFLGKGAMEKQEFYENFHSILHLIDEPFDKEDFIITNNLRHYHIQRLLKSIVILTKVDSSYVRLLWNCLSQSIHSQPVLFQHEKVQECLDEILKSKSLDPLFSLWHHFMAYKFANDSLFLQEFVMLEYMLYRKLIDCLRVLVLKTSPTAEDFIELYTSIAALPVPEMLNSLDALVEELIVIMEKYELDTAMSWSQWFKKYWWVPPVITASVIVNFLLGHRE